MSKPWKGAAQRATAQDFVTAAEELGCEVAALEAVWQIEASGKPFRSDGTLERRFEPHKLRKPEGNYKTSAALSFAAREAKFDAAYARNAEDAMRASSWGGPQIMGFNANAAGYPTAGAMVEAMAASESEQIRAFVRLIKAWGLASALRSHDWRAFAARYNGNANVAEYSARIETAYQKLSGRLRRSCCARVTRVWRSGGCNMPRDRCGRQLRPGHGQGRARFPEAPWPDRRRRGGAAHVEGPRGLFGHPACQAARGTGSHRPASEIVALASTAAGAMATVGGALPESSVNLLIIAAAVIGIGALALHAFRKLRGVA